MKVVANPVLWKFSDATAPVEWKSKQARRIYDAAISAEASGDWINHAVAGSVRIATHRTTIPSMVEPQFGYRTPDAAIESMMRIHIAALRAHATKLENVLHAYGPKTFRTQRAALPGPKHPFDAEQRITEVISRPDVNELWVHGQRFVRDASRAFVRADNDD